MNALEELPNSDKNTMLPLVGLRPWVRAYEFESVLERVEAAYGKNRPWIPDIDPALELNNIENPRPVHRELERLRNPENSFGNWCEFLSGEDMGQAIPCLQFSNDPDLLDEAQVDTLLALNRGLVLRVGQAHFGALNNLLGPLANVPGDQLLVVLDYGKMTGDVLNQAAQSAALVNNVSDNFEGVSIVIAGTSFPSGFVDITQQEIFERTFFLEVQAASGDKVLIYGDYGSARAERILGGGGQPAPRVDYPLGEMWFFERRGFDDDDDDTTKEDLYEDAANALIESDEWDENLRIWGTQMIERTALGDRHAITSPARSTAVRINIHLHRQTHYGGPPDELYNTEDDWED